MDSQGRAAFTDKWNEVLIIKINRDIARDMCWWGYRKYAPNLCAYNECRSYPCIEALEYQTIVLYVIYSFFYQIFFPTDWLIMKKQQHIVKSNSQRPAAIHSKSMVETSTNKSSLEDVLLYTELALETKTTERGCGWWWYDGSCSTVHLSTHNHSNHSCVGGVGEKMPIEGRVDVCDVMKCSKGGNSKWAGW